MDIMVSEKFDTTKEYLGQIERLDRMIQNKLSEISQLRHISTSVTIAPKDVNVQTSPDQDKLGATVSKIFDLERETDELVDAYIDRRKKIISQIDSMSDTKMYHVLSERYVIHKDLNRIAVEMGYSFKQICRIHGKALAEFERMYGNEYLENN